MDKSFEEMESKNLISFGKNPNQVIFSGNNSLDNIADFMYILKFCEVYNPDRTHWTLKTYGMALAGGSRRLC